MDPLIKKETEVTDKKTGEAVVVEENKELDKVEEEKEKKSIFDAIEENKEIEEAVAIKEGPEDRWEVSS